MRFVPLTIGLLAIGVFTSCRPHHQSSWQPVPFVREILLDKQAPQWDIFANAAEDMPSGNIAIVGESGYGQRLAEYLCGYDRKNNVDGSLRYDALPDFAGETFDCIGFDNAMNDSIAVRSAEVKIALAALDTMVFLSPYDLDMVLSKKRAKLIVNTSPRAVFQGKSDIDTLFSVANCQIKFVYPMYEVLENLFESVGERSIHIAVIKDKSSAYSSSDYEELLKSVSSRKGYSASTIFVTDKHNLIEILDDYVAAGRDKPLDAIVVDDTRVSVDLLKIELADLLSMLNPLSIVYRPLIADSFDTINTADVVADACYDILRQNNLFTHNISYPSISYYNSKEIDGNNLLFEVQYVQN